MTGSREGDLRVPLNPDAKSRAHRVDLRLSHRIQRAISLFRLLPGGEDVAVSVGPRTARCSRLGAGEATSGHGLAAGRRGRSRPVELDL
jgi:hypothetical protein